MTIVRQAVLLVAALGALLCGPAGASAKALPVATAPGRVVISTDGGVVANTDSSGGGGAAAVALPDGGAVAVADGPGGQAVLVAITANGALDPSFGTGGTATLTPGFPAYGVLQMIRQPDGKLVLLASGSTANDLQFPQLVAIRLNPDGTPDQSFGAGGVDLLPIQESCSCATIALRPGGGFVVSGSTGGQSPAIETNPEAIPESQWVVAGLTPTGALDPSFGQSGIATVVGTGALAAGLAVLPDGDIVTDGQVAVGNLRYQSQLTRLLPSGAPDPTFNGGTPQTLPAVDYGGPIANADGTVIVEVPHAIIRYTNAGLPDQTFGNGGIVQIGSPDTTQAFALLPAAGDGALIVLENGGEYAEGHDVVERIAANGAVDPTLGGPTGLAFTTPFGGGSSGLLTTLHPQALPPLDQNTFGGNVVQRPDGSYLLLGGVAVSEPTGEGDGESIEDFAAIALTPSFGVETSFGGPATPLHARVAIIAQRATTARARHGIRVTTTVSAAGLARVAIKASGRVVAQSVLPVFGPNPRTLPVELTSFGDTWLKGHPRARLTVSLKARDLLTNVATASAAGALR
jgi:uncharacterized delta-60 repeat protein